MAHQLQPLTPEELAALGLLQMANRTKAMITESRAICRSIDAVLATVAADPNLTAEELADIFGGAE